MEAVNFTNAERLLLEEAKILAQNYATSLVKKIDELCLNHNKSVDFYCYINVKGVMEDIVSFEIELSNVLFNNFISKKDDIEKVFCPEYPAPITFDVKPNSSIVVYGNFSLSVIVKTIVGIIEDISAKKKEKRKKTKHFIEKIKCFSKKFFNDWEVNVFYDSKNKKYRVILKKRYIKLENKSLKNLIEKINFLSNIRGYFLSAHIQSNSKSKSLIIKNFQVDILGKDLAEMEKKIQEKFKKILLVIS